KFWSKKPRNEANIILEEFVDNIHFLLSFGLDKGYRFTGNVPASNISSETEQFTRIFASCVRFKEEPTAKHYEEVFQQYLQLGKLLGFSESDIQEAYFRKNKINYERQDEGY